MQQELRDLISETAKATPAVAGAAASTYTLNEWLIIATSIYIGLQALYLLRKWWREESDWAWLKRKNHRGKK